MVLSSLDSWSRLVLVLGLDLGLLRLLVSRFCHLYPFISVGFGLNLAFACRQCCANWAIWLSDRFVPRVLFFLFFLFVLFFMFFLLPRDYTRRPSLFLLFCSSSRTTGRLLSGWWCAPRRVPRPS